MVAVALKVEDYTTLSADVGEPSSIMPVLDQAIAAGEEKAITLLESLLLPRLMSWLIEIRTKMAAMTAHTARLVGDGVAVDTAGMGAIIDDRELQYKRQRDHLLRELRSARFQLQAGDRLVRQALTRFRNRVETIYDEAIAELRRARSILALIERTAPRPETSRLRRAFDAYYMALPAESGGAARVREAETAWTEDGYPYYVLHVEVPDNLYEDTNGRLEAETRAHGRVEEIDPSLVGMFAISYHPQAIAA